MSSPSPIVSQIRHAAAALVFVLGIAVLPNGASAQYMYLDSNGDGEHTEADVVNPSGSTTIDVYLVTDQGADGSPAVCLQGDDPFTMMSYTVVLRATGGHITWGVPVNQIPQFGFTLGFFPSETEMVYGKAGTMQPPGTYRLMTITATVASGSPEIQIVATAETIDPRFGFTQFGSLCLGERGANTMRLGEDWFDVGGLPVGTATPPNSSPVLAPIHDMSAVVGEFLAQTATATDPDGQILAISLLDGPAYLSLTTLSKDRGTAAARINLTPVRGDTGPTTGSVTVSDGESTTATSFAITVEPGSDHPTRLSPIGDLAVTCGRILTEPIHARDPDGELLDFSKVSGPSFIAVTTLANGPGGAQGLLRLTPTICDAGVHEAAIEVGGGGLSDRALVRINAAIPLRISGETERRFVGGNALLDAVLADFNQDGHTDIAAVDRFPTGIHVLLGDGNGSFIQHSEFSTVENPLRIVSGDWDQDGLPDLGVLDWVVGELAVHHGHGDGSFGAGPVLATGAGAQDFLTTDLNDDGLLDFVVANSSGSFVSIFLGSGGGSFAPRIDVSTGGSAFCVAAADLNNDGRLDLVVGTFVSRMISVHLGFGDGTFQDPIVTPVSALPYSVSAADLNEDGRADLVIMDYEGTLVAVIGDGTGRFSPKSSESGFGIAPAEAIADVNGDGHLDVAVVGQYHAGVTALFGDGSGGFPSRAELSTTIATRAALGDVNGDAIPDLVVPSGGPAAILVRLNTIGAGTAVEARAFVKDPKRTRPGAAGSNSFCALLEPVNASYSNTDVNYSSLTLESEGTGSASSITATPTKTILEGDTDGNGVAEISACFSGADMARLFDQVNGRRTVHVNLKGALKDGRRFCSGFDMTVVGAGGPLAATVTPNPLNPSGVLSFRTSRDGYVRVRMFDLNGRLVRVLANLSLAPAGDQEIRIDGRGGHGETLATGAYFYVVETPEGKTRGRIMILK